MVGVIQETASICFCVTFTVILTPKIATFRIPLNKSSSIPTFSVVSLPSAFSPSPCLFAPPSPFFFQFIALREKNKTKQCSFIPQQHSETFQRGGSLFILSSSLKALQSTGNMGMSTAFLFLCAFILFSVLGLQQEGHWSPSGQKVTHGTVMSSCV